MEIITTSRGGEKLCYGGYMYTKKATKTNRIRWECSQRESADCKGALTTSLVVVILLNYINNLLIIE